MFSDKKKYLPQFTVSKLYLWNRLHKQICSCRRRWDGLTEKSINSWTLKHLLCISITLFLLLICHIRKKEENPQIFSKMYFIAYEIMDTHCTVLFHLSNLQTSTGKNLIIILIVRSQIWGNCNLSVRRGERKKINTARLQRENKVFFKLLS